MKAIIITRALDESPDSEGLRALLNATDILKIAINTVDVKANIRLFMDTQLWQNYTNYSEFMLTTTRGLTLIPEEQQNKFNYFNIEKMPCTDENTELFCMLGSLGASLDLAYKMGVKELLLVADNNVIEDDKAFFKGYREQAKDVADFYNTKMNIYQFSLGNFNLPVKTIKDFI